MTSIESDWGKLCFGDKHRKTLRGTIRKKMYFSYLIGLACLGRASNSVMPDAGCSWMTGKTSVRWKVLGSSLEKLDRTLNFEV